MQELDADAEERNYSREPLRRREIEEIVRAAGSVAAVLNSRHAVAKERGWKEKAPSRKAFVDAVLDDDRLLRRPVLIRDGEAVVGKDEQAIRALLS